MLIPENIKIYLYLPATDMRKSIDTLCILIADVLSMQPGDGNLFLFRSRQGNKIKAIYYEENCFTLIYRRLEKGKFIFPKKGDGTIEMTRDYLKWLLASDKYLRLNPQEKTIYQYFC